MRVAKQNALQNIQYESAYSNTQKIFKDLFFLNKILKAKDS